MHDGATAFSIAVSNNLHATYPGRWVEFGRPAVWPPHSPNLNTFDFFIFGQLKSLAHETFVATVEIFMAWIVVASVDITSTPNLFEIVLHSFVCLCRLCYDLSGSMLSQLRTIPVTIPCRCISDVEL
ncbi:uncharacterized protein TNCV_2786331 [Trichonephila clavipes]|nr:uncharacterized protein TNCV_2786331 [Trichonephila clavipes]